MAAASAGLPSGGHASMIVDMAADHGVAIMSLADIAVVQSLRVAGDELDAAIIAICGASTT